MTELQNTGLGWALKVAVAVAAAAWGGLAPMIQLLIVLMVVDFGTGLLAGFVTKTLSSDVSYRGLAKKTIVLLLVLMAVFLERKAGLVVTLPGGVELSASNAVAGFYAFHEGLSSLENAARANLPVPMFLTEALAKLKQVA